MKIGIDARKILSPEKGDEIGVGHYTYQLIRHLLEIDKENEYVLFFDFRVREKDVRKFSRPNVKIKFYPFSDYKKYLPGVYNELLGTATLQKENLDILHSTSPFSRIPAGYSGKTLVTFHDLASFSIPQCFPKVKRMHGKAVLNLMSKKADRIIAVSQSLKNELKNILKVDEEKIDVIYSGLDKRFFEEQDLDGHNVAEKYGAKKKYILFLGTIEPLKNITRLLEAFAEFKERSIQKDSAFGSGKFKYQLVLAGKNGWLAKEYRQIVKDFGLQKDVIFTGYIIGDELVPLFRGAEFFVLPSLYEGFGTTVLEAFATQTPAIVSRVSSLPEIAGEAAYFVNPLNIYEIAEAMFKFSTDDEMRNDFRKKGLEQAQKFDWEKCAQETLEVYKSFEK